MSHSALFMMFLLNASWASTGLAQSPLPRVSMVEELRLRAGTEDFPEVSQLYVGPRSEIAVPLQADMQVRFYDSSGNRLSAVGRRGRGPGEFLSIGAVGWVGDSIWIVDGQQTRTTFLDSGRGFVRSELWPEATSIGGIRTVGFPPFIPISFYSDGTMLGRARWMETSGEAHDIYGLRRRNGELQKVFALPPARSSPWLIAIYDCCTFLMPFARPPQVAASSDGSLVAMLSVELPKERTGRFRIDALHPSGDTVYSRWYPFVSEPISPRARDSALAVVVPRPDHLINVPSDLVERVRAEARARMPTWSIEVETMLVGLDRTIWIEYRPKVEGRRYLVLSSIGDPVGQLLVPRSTRIRQASAGRIWVTETDADGLSDIVRYRLTGLSCVAGRC